MTDPQESMVAHPQSPNREAAIVNWLESMKEQKPRMWPVFEFSERIPEHQGLYMAAHQFDDGRPRIILHVGMEHHRRDYEPLFPKPE